MHQKIDLPTYGSEMFCDALFDMHEPRTVHLDNPQTLLLFLCCPRVHRVKTASNVPKKQVDITVYGPLADGYDRLAVTSLVTAEAAWSGLSRDERQLLLNELARRQVVWRNVAKALNIAISR